MLVVLYDVLCFLFSVFIFVDVFDFVSFIYWYGYSDEDEVIEWLFVEGVFEM